MDAYRHINNAAYLTYLEEVRVAMLRGRDGFAAATVVSRNEIDYVRPIVYSRHPLRVAAWIDDVRAASFLVRYEVFDHDTLAARALSTCVLFDFERNTLRRISADERTALSVLLDNP
jgi:acyl-CoA thioester hydrolase